MSSSRKFSDRIDAGEQLGAAVDDHELDADIVLAVPRGGLPVGRAVADALGVPLDIVVASKIGAPGNPEYAIGAVASDGTVWRNEQGVGRRVDEDYFEREREKEREIARHKAETYRGERSAPDLAGKTVVVVDDGVATGSTVRACLRMLEAAETERVVLAVPVGPPTTIRELETLADEVICLEQPRRFSGVGQFYRRFGQVTDEEAMAFLEAES